MKKIGLTGGIGSGKTTVAEIFRHLGIPVFVSDEVARVLQEEDAAVKKSIAEIFGKDIYAGDKLNREQVATIVFADKNKLAQLNAVVHPAVAKAFEKFCEENKHAKYVLKEAAILFEIGDDKNLDAMIVVTAPEELRVQRVTMRDGSTDETVLKRMKNQWAEEEKVKKAGYVIVNNEKELLLPQIIKIDSQLR